MITAIVLAAGKSSRMEGKNKMFLPFGATTVISTVIAELIMSKVDEIIVVTDSDEHFNELAIVSKVKACVNPNPGDGLTSSIQTGINFADKNSAYMICLGDMPLITYKEYNKLIDKFLECDNKAIIQPFKDNIPGNPVLFANAFRSEILDLDTGNGCRPVVQANEQFVSKIIMTSDSYFTDIDTKDQYSKALRNWP